MTTTKATLIAVLLAACVTEDEPLDASGTWQTSWVWGSGTCGLTGTASDTMLLTPIGENSYAVTVPPGTAITSITGAVSCSPEVCVLPSTSP